MFVFSVTEKNNKYKLLDENGGNKIELIKFHADKNHEDSKTSINDGDEIIKKSNQKT